MPTRRTASLLPLQIPGKDDSLLPKSKSARRVPFRPDQFSASGTPTAASNPIRQRQTNPKADFAPERPAATPLVVLRAAITACLRRITKASWDPTTSKDARERPESGAKGRVPQHRNT